MYQGIEHNFSQMGLYEQSSHKKLPPAVAPKPKKHNAAPAPYRPGKKMMLRASFIYLLAP